MTDNRIEVLWFRDITRSYFEKDGFIIISVEYDPFMWNQMDEELREFAKRNNYKVNGPWYSTDAWFLKNSTDTL
jgi:hypothetical protein